MVCALLGTIVVGMVLGYAFLDITIKPLLDDTLMTALDFMGFVAGIEIGSNRRLLKQICTPKNLALALALPTGVVVGSLGGAYASHFLTGLSVYDSILVGSGLGWYSLSSVVISTMYSTELGAVAFLANMLREVSSFVLIPLLARWNKLMSIAPGGAGTMEHFYDALTEGGADAALAASLFHYKELEICEVKQYLQSRGVSVRL